MVVGAGAAAALVAVDADLVVLAAVQNGEGVAQPEAQRPEEQMRVGFRFTDNTHGKSNSHLSC